MAETTPSPAPGHSWKRKTAAQKQRQYDRAKERRQEINAELARIRAGIPTIYVRGGDA